MLFTVLADRPTIRINQLGYLPDGPKRATWVTDEAAPVEFIIEATDGSVVFRGRSEPWPADWLTTGDFDVSGGWYDAGDYGKYTVSAGISLWQLLNLAALIRRLG